MLIRINEMNKSVNKLCVCFSLKMIEHRVCKASTLYFLFHLSIPKSNSSSFQLVRTLFIYENDNRKIPFSFKAFGERILFPFVCVNM